MAQKTMDSEICRGEITWRALHECIPLSRYGMRKGRHEQHNTDKNRRILVGLICCVNGNSACLASG